VTIAAGGAYTIDRWLAFPLQASKFSVQQNAGSVTPPAGFVNYLGVTSTSAYSVVASDTFLIAQAFEGFNVSDLDFGKATAKTVTLSFWVRSSLTGTFGGSLAGATITRSYPFNYTISSANTWEYKSITIPGDTSGTWSTDNSSFGAVRFGLGSGSTFSGTAGSWTAGNVVQPTGSVSVVGTNGATFYITGVQLEAGSTATDFERRPYGTELALCQRYFYKTYDPGVAVGTSGAVGGILCETLASGTLTRLKAFNPQLAVSMRATPTVTLYSQTGTADRITVYNNDASTLTVSSVAGESTNCLCSYITTTASATADQTYLFHATASAEL
jgi:hypothetical protein